MGQGRRAEPGQQPCRGLLQAAGTGCFHQLAGRDPARAKARWPGVRARSGREEGPGLRRLAAGFGFVQQAVGSRGLLLGTEAIAQGGLVGGPPGRSSRGPPRWAALEAGAVQPTPSRFPQTHGFHPCWPRGYSTQVPLRDLYASPCTAAQRPQTFNGSDRVHLEGGSDPALCRGLVSGLFNFSSCRFSRCSFNGIFQPPVSGDFMVSPGDGVGPLPCSAWGLGTPGLYPPPRPSRLSSTPWTS